MTSVVSFSPELLDPGEETAEERVVGLERVVPLGVPIP